MGAVRRSVSTGVDRGGWDGFESHEVEVSTPYKQAEPSNHTHGQRVRIHVTRSGSVGVSSSSCRTKITGDTTIEGRTTPWRSMLEETGQSALLLPIVYSMVGVAMTSLVAGLVYVYKTQTTASIELIIDTNPAPPKIDVVVTNSGRSPIVVTALRIHMPPDCLGLPGGLTDPLKDVPIWRRGCLLGLRRRFKTSGSKNDIIAKSIKRAVPQGFAIIDVIKGRETMRVGSQEKVSKTAPLNEAWGSFWYELPIVGEVSNPIFLIPSCKIAKHKPLVWGPPKILGRASTGVMGIWQLGMNWD